MKRIWNITFWVVAIGVFVWSVYSLLSMFVFMSFRVPSGSMEPTIMTEDHVLVNRLSYGDRIFAHSLDSIRHGDITRGWSYSEPHHNDIVVFNNPVYVRWDTISFNKQKYFVKRCIALPGDTFEIRNGYYHASSYDGPLGNIEAQNAVETLTRDTSITQRQDIPYWTAPFYHPVYHWNIREMGPLYVPQKGDTIHLDTISAPIYKHLIEWEINKKITEHEGKFYVDGEPFTEHIMEQGYYFMAGDNVLYSQDSRYWGLVPEEFIVGRVVLIY